MQIQPNQDGVNELLRRVLFLPPQASSVARHLDYLHYFVIITTMVGAVAITIVGLYLLVRYRARDGTFRREDPTARPPVWAEIGVVAGLLGMFCLWWLIGFSQFVELQVAPEDALTVYITGKQWMWKFAYPSGESTIATLYVPAGRPIKLLLTSRDVIHSFYVPDFRIKQDAVPGRYTTAWFNVTAPGTHQVLCAEYCGTGHSTMRAQVVALSPQDYARWQAAARIGADPAAHEPAGLVSVGTQVAADMGCLRCHTLDGSPHIGPTWAGMYLSLVPLVGGGTVIADEAYITESIMDPQAKIHAGFTAVMPSYHELIAPGQVASIIELMKAVRGVPAQPPYQASQQGLPPPGSIPNPPPRLPVQVQTSPGARP